MLKVLDINNNVNKNIVNFYFFEKRTILYNILKTLRIITYLYLNAYIYRNYIFKSSSISFIIKIIILNEISVIRLYFVDNIYEN